MVFVPGGAFKMGGDEADDEKPVHTVQVEGFWMYTKEVTNGQYRKFLAANPEWTPERIDSKLHDGDYLKHWKEQSPASKDDSYPVVYVPWYAAQAYAEWAGGRLPTEAEWEYAARGGKQFEYGTATGEISDQLANYGTGTKPVGSYRPNPFGLYDLTGNVWEWCSSLYKEYPYRANDGREDPDDSGFRVVRGGSWGVNGPLLRAAFRNNLNPQGCGPVNGFRVVVLRAGVP
jgi:formylglycine-generating enzyme required for sulfatase activity